MAMGGHAENKGAEAAAPRGRRKGNPALEQPVQPDERLAAVIGAEPRPRPQVVKSVWDYIKAEGLQDEKNRRMINADEKLKAVFDGRSKVSMFELAKFVARHVA